MDPEVIISELEEEFEYQRLVTSQAVLNHFFKSLSPFRSHKNFFAYSAELYPHLTDDLILNRFADEWGDFFAVRLSINDNLRTDSTKWCSSICYEINPNDLQDQHSYIPSYTIHRFDSKIIYRNWFEDERCYGCQRYLAKGIVFRDSTHLFPFDDNNMREFEKPIILNRCFVSFWSKLFLENVSHY